MSEQNCSEIFRVLEYPSLAVPLSACALVPPSAAGRGPCSPPPTSGKCISCVARCSFADDTIYSRYIVVFKYLLTARWTSFTSLFLPPSFLPSLLSSVALISRFCTRNRLAIARHRTNDRPILRSTEWIERTSSFVRRGLIIIISGQIEVASNLVCGYLCSLSMYVCISLPI